MPMHTTCPRQPASRSMWPGLVANKEMVRIAGVAILSAVLAISAGGQQAPRSPQPTKLLSVDRVPDYNSQMKINQHKAQDMNLDAANRERKRQIDDETAKLLILARDLKLQMDRAGDMPLPPVVVKEAAVIEILANDVKVKMRMTVGGN